MVAFSQCVGPLGYVAQNNSVAYSLIGWIVGCCLRILIMNNDFAGISYIFESFVLFAADLINCRLFC